MTDGDARARRGTGSALVWAALALPLAAAVAALGARAGWWPFGTGLWAALGVGAAAVLLALSAAVLAIRAWRGGAYGRAARACVAVLVALGPAAMVGIEFVRALTLPPIHDISTDLEDPPRFAAVAILAAERANLLEHGGKEVARQQRAAYPDIEPLFVPVPPQAAFARAHALAESLGWNIVEAAPQEGRIEAVATTFWFGFRDDVAIRIRPAGDGGSRIDLRSVSRVGKSDLGANARRIRRFIEHW